MCIATRAALADMVEPAFRVHPVARVIAAILVRIRNLWAEPANTRMIVAH